MSLDLDLIVQASEETKRTRPTSAPHTVPRTVVQAIHSGRNEERLRCLDRRVPIPGRNLGSSEQQLSSVPLGNDPQCLVDNDRRHLWVRMPNRHDAVLAFDG